MITNVFIQSVKIYFHIKAKDVIQTKVLAVLCCHKIGKNLPKMILCFTIIFVKFYAIYFLYLLLSSLLS